MMEEWMYKSLTNKLNDTQTYRKRTATSRSILAASSDTEMMSYIRQEEVESRSSHWKCFSQIEKVFGLVLYIFGKVVITSNILQSRDQIFSSIDEVSSFYKLKVKL